jgi:cytochrome oxidase assembly protein ShyY1
MHRYRFALKPRWILSHLFVAAMVVAMVSAGFWQLRRLDEKRERNDQVAALAELPVVEVSELADPGDYDAVEPIEYRVASATGFYRADEELLVRNRSFGGAPGSWVMTPLETTDGSVVLVNRGWIPNSGQLDAVPPEAAAPSGRVTVEGLVRATETRGRIGATDPADGRLTDLARADVARIDEQTDGELLPFYLQLQRQDPPPGDEAPEPVPVPEPDEGPHLSYAGQWFIFATLTLIVYPLILRRRARELERERALSPAPPP